MMFSNKQKEPWKYKKILFEIFLIFLFLFLNLFLIYISFI